MLVAVCGPVGKSSLIHRITRGSFSLQYTPTYFTEIHKILVGNMPMVLVETKDVIKCDVVLLLCRKQSDVQHLWRAYCGVSRLPPVVVRVGEDLDHEDSWLGHELHRVSNLTADGISELIWCLYIKSRMLTKYSQCSCRSC
jgi:hypothetical protein